MDAPVLETFPSGSLVVGVSEDGITRIRFGQFCVIPDASPREACAIVLSEITYKAFTPISNEVGISDAAARIGDVEEDDEEEEEDFVMKMTGISKANEVLPLIPFVPFPNVCGRDITVVVGTVVVVVPTPLGVAAA